MQVVVTNEVRTKVVNTEALAQLAAVEQQSDQLGEAVPLVGEPVRIMSAQIEAALKEKGIRTLPITVVPFVELQKPHQTTEFGVEVAEGFYHELQARGFNLIDFQTVGFDGTSQPAHKQKQPKLSDLYKQHRISYVVTGNYTATADGVNIHARVLDTVTRQVVASGQSHIGVAALEGGLPGYHPMSSREGFIVENGGVPTQ